MKNNPYPPDLEAEVSFIPTEQGGRKTPALSKYRPQFYYEGQDWDADHEYPDVESVLPGQTARTLLRFLSPEMQIGRVHPGLEFKVREGARVVAHGKVTKVLDLVANAKRSLRHNIRSDLGATATADRAAASLQLCALLEKQPLWQKAKTILFFAPLPYEPDIWPLFADSLAAGKTALLPRFEVEHGHYTVCHITDIERDIQTGKFGIREPRDNCVKFSLNRLDLILVPGIAFDWSGRRLGRGKGFYDQLLAALHGPTCGVAFDQQIVRQIPVESHDIRLSCILTPTRWQGETASARL